MKKTFEGILLKGRAFPMLTKNLFNEENLAIFTHSKCGGTVE